MKKILDSLKKEDRPLSVDEISEKVDIPAAKLRRNLYRLQEEGKVRSREKQGELKWEIESKDPVEEKYEKMTRENRS